MIDGIHELIDDAAKAYRLDIRLARIEAKRRTGSSPCRITLSNTTNNNVTSGTPKERRNGVGQKGTEGKDGSVEGI